MGTMFQGVEKDSRAFRLMQQMGWEEGGGLGKNKQGMKQHLRVQNKQDNAGIGIDQKTKAQTLWKVNTMQYDDVLNKLKVVVGQATAEIAADGSDEDEEAEEKLSAKSANVAEAEEDEKPRVIKASRPQGRYKSREKGKMVGSYSKTDLSAILGGTGELETTPQRYQSNKVLPDCNSSMKVDEPIEQVSKEASQENVKMLDPATDLVDLPDDWWGKKHGFVRAGRLGATSGTLKTERSAFQEKDQEELAKLAHEKATKGKKGLGAGGKMKTAKGAGWKGQRKALDIESDEEDNEIKEQVGKAPTSTKCEYGEQIKTEAPTKDIVVKGKSECGAGEENLKLTQSWKKVCKRLLREAPLQTLSLKRLGKRFCSTMLSTYGVEAQLDIQKLHKSSRFVVEGKTVRVAM